MKISVTLFLASVASTSAFVAPAAESRCTFLGMSDPNKWEDEWGGVDMEVKSLKGPATTNDAPAKPSGPVKSQSIPFMTVHPSMDGSMAGDVGFDPLGFADSRDNLNMYREAEVKHARLAMLAAAGWPLSELWDKNLADLFGMDAVLDASNRVPSVLNGGMNKISPFYWVGCLALAGALDVLGLSNVSKMKGYFPGNFGFDPLGLYPKDQKGQKWMQTAEIKNGRLAMIAITGMAIQEFATGVSVVDQYPIFFKPIWEVLSNSVPSYSVPEEVVQDAATAAVSSFSEISSATTEAAVVAPEAMSAATTEAAVVVPEVVSAATTEAAVVAPEPMSAATAAADVSNTVPASAAEAVSVAAPVAPPVVDTLPAVPVEAPAAIPSAVTAPTASVEDLAAAKARIAELEAKLRVITDLSQ